MKVWDYIDVTNLEEYIESGLVTCKWHHEFNELMILSYGRRAVLEQHWDAMTTRCRGLIVNMVTGDVVARPFEKFFDVDTPGRPETDIRNLPKEQPQVLEKINGSLGTLYVYKGIHSIASKASFHSKHAEWATEWYRNHVSSPIWPIGFTPVFEMICQEIQPHTVQYEQDGLYLIGLIHVDTGMELGYGHLCTWARLNNVGLPERFDVPLIEAIGHNRAGEEGYVCTWPSTWYAKAQPPRRVRIKFPEFLRRRALFNRTGKKQILQQLRDHGRLPDEWLESGMPHLTERIIAGSDELYDEYRRIFSNASRILRETLKTCTTRTEYAACFNKDENKLFAPVCFAILDERDYKRVIWNLIEKNFAFEPVEDAA